jgi:hypothetical protein
MLTLQATRGGVLELSDAEKSSWQVGGTFLLTVDSFNAGTFK